MKDGQTYTEFVAELRAKMSNKEIKLMEEWADRMNEMFQFTDDDYAEMEWVLDMLSYEPQEAL